MIRSFEYLIEGVYIMRHAYLVIAHSNWTQLELLLTLLDKPNNAIYVHIDAKVKNAPIDRLRKNVKYASIHLYQKNKVFWGSFELVQTELFLFKKAYSEHFDYYHLLSGTDLPIKTQDEIDAFFTQNYGYQFVHFDTEERLRMDKEIKRRTKYYHFLQNYRRRFSINFFNVFFTTLERISIVFQIAFRIDRMKKHPNLIIKYGSQWVSITDDLVGYILKNEQLINNVFRHTNCADELFIQTLVFNSDFREQLYDKDFDDDNRANMRLIDMKMRGKNGSPYTWKLDDINEIEQSACLFARKFDINTDARVVQAVYNHVKN